MAKSSRTSTQIIPANIQRAIRAFGQANRHPKDSGAIDQAYLELVEQIALINPRERIERPTFEASFSKDDIQDFESNYENDFGYSRRLTFLALTRSADETIEAFDELLDEPDGGETIAHLLKQIEDYREHCEACLEFATEAHTKLLGVVMFMAQGDDHAE